MTTIKIQIPENKHVAILGARDKQSDKIVICDTKEELHKEITIKDMISVILYRDEKWTIEDTGE